MGGLIAAPSVSSLASGHFSWTGRSMIIYHRLIKSYDDDDDVHFYST